MICHQLLTRILADSLTKEIHHPLEWRVIIIIIIFIKDNNRPQICELTCFLSSIYEQCLPVFYKPDFTHINVIDYDRQNSVMIVSIIYKLTHYCFPSNWQNLVLVPGGCLRFCITQVYFLCIGKYRMFSLITWNFNKSLRK